MDCRGGVRAIVHAGMEMRRPYSLALFAEPLLAAGNGDEAQAVPVAALAVAARTDETWSEAEKLYLLGTPTTLVRHWSI